MFSMNKKMVEYLIIATAVILLIYGCYAIVSYKYPEKETTILDSITMYYPSTSEYTIEGNTVEFRNPNSFYDMDVSILNSSDEKITNLLSHYSNLNRGTIDYKNETCYQITIEYNGGSGFKYHSMVIPYDSFDKGNLSFTKQTDVFLFEANNREFVVDTVFNSGGAI